MFQKSQIGIIGAGAFGGAGPILVNIGADFLKGDWPNITGLIAAAIFALIGASVALIYRESSPQKAFMLGIGAPALIAGALGNADIGSPSASSQPTGDNPTTAAPTPSEHTNRGSWWLTFGSVAYAQPSTPAQLVITPPTGFPIDDAVFVVVQPAQAEGATPTTQNVIVALPPKGSDDRVRVQIPANATAVSVRGGGVSSSVVQFPAAAGPVRLSVTVEKPIWSGFLQAVGMKNAARKGVKMEATLQQAPPPP